MNRFKILSCLFLGTFVYTILSVSVGPCGILSQRQLEAQKIRVAGNLSLLIETREDLESLMKNLSADPDTISVYAHELGYVREGEQMIKLAGFSGGINRKLLPGSAIRAERPDFLPELFCKLFGFVAGIGLFVLFILFQEKQPHDSSTIRS